MARVNVQNVFRKVIEAGYYQNSMYMCFSLGAAVRAGKVSKEELRSASAAIEREILGSSTLRGHINSKLKGIQCIGSSQLQKDKIGNRIYWNWYDRKRTYARLQKKYSKAVVRGS